MDLFFEIHQDIPREGPGDDLSTAQALGMLRDLPDVPHILDIGCGPGQQTLVLARETGGQVLAVDTHQPFLDRLSAQAAQTGLSDRIAVQNASMFDLALENNSFDLIWSEGAIYIIGFSEGLKAWNPFLKPGGYLGVTEISWLVENPPSEVLEFWKQDYPGMSGITSNIHRILACGYKFVGCFVLPRSSWETEYYQPLEERMQQIRGKYPGNNEVLALLEQTSKEITLFREFPDTFSYVFYLMRKPSEK